VANIAIFDLDYTLTKRGTWGRFTIRSVRFKPWLWLPLCIAAARAQWRYKQGSIPRIQVKQAMMRWSMVGQSRGKLEKLADNFGGYYNYSKRRRGYYRSTYRVALGHNPLGGHANEVGT